MPPKLLACGRFLYNVEHKGCVYTYPDIRISGYPDVRDPDISDIILRGRLAVCRRNTQMHFFFGQVACLQTLFHFSFLFVDVSWLDDKVKVLGCLASSVIDYKRQRRIWHGYTGNWSCACEMAFKIDEPWWKLLNQIGCYRTGKARKNVLEGCGRRKHRFQVEGNRRAHAQ